MPTPRTARQTALDLLARREHSPAELARKLRLRNFDADEITITVQTLEQQGLLSQTRFVENFIHFRRNKGFGPLRIQAELIERGISEEHIEQALNFADNAWFTEAQRAWQKRFKNKKPVDYKARAQQMRFLHYRGFTHEQIESVLANME